MKLLLDTQIFIWWDSEPERLPAGLLRLCEDEGNALVVSVASIWEMQIKAQLGKLELRRPLEQIIREQQNDNQLGLLPIEAAHVLGLQMLSFHHKDAFDRLIIAQAITEGIPVLSVDAVFRQYPAQVFSV